MRSQLAVGLLVLCLSTGFSAAADESAAKAKLAAKGIRVTHSGLSLSDESEFTRGFGEISKLKRKLTTATREREAIQRQEEQVQADIRERLQQNVAIHSQLAAVNPRDVITHNKLVALANANTSAINLMLRDQDQGRKEIDAVRQSTNSVREEYVQHLLDLRKIADRISAKYASLAQDKEVEAALKEWNEANNTSLEVAPSRTFKSALKRLETLEKGVITDSIPLRRERNSFFASVVLNGKHAHEMIVDSGASLLTLPSRVAAECDITVGPTDPSITLKIANGARIKGKVTTLASVRVGKFVAENVPCAVLAPDASEAMPLLGMSFLGRYKFELNSDAAKLSLMTIESGTTSHRPTSKKPAKSTKRTPRRAASDD